MEETVTNADTSVKIKQYKQHIFITNKQCKLCNVYYRDSTHKRRHESTNKHRDKAIIFREKHQIPDIITESRFQCNKCHKNYKFMSGLSRHKARYHEDYDTKSAIVETNNDNNDMISIMKDILKTQLTILSQQKTQNEALSNSNITFNNQGVYINKQVLNVNLYLNEHCNNAVSLIDFINNLNLTLDDLKETKSLGYVNGVSNILVKKLVSLKPTERPIHCDNTDNEGFEFYVKEKSNWMKDIGNKKIDWSIENVSKKQIEMLKIWEKMYPNWMNSDKETETYLEMVKLCMGGASPDEIDKNKDAIKRALANGVKIEDILSISD